MKLFNKLVALYEFIQLPVYSFSRSLTSLVSGLYMDEFAEVHTKDLEVRLRLAAVLSHARACLPVSAERRSQHLMDLEPGRRPFVPRRSPEAYDIAFRVSELGLKSSFIAYPASYAITSTSACGAAPCPLRSHYR